MNMLTDNLSHIDILAWIDKEFATVLQLVNGICKGVARFESYHRTVDTALNISLVGLILLESVSHDGLTLTGCQHVGTQSDDATRRYVKLDVGALTLTFHRCHLTLAARHHVYHLRRKLLRHVDGQLLNRFLFLAINLFVNHLRLSNLQLIAFAAHGLDEHREV